MKLLFTAFFIFVATIVTAQTTKPQLNHIAVYVKNLQTSTQFYKNIIGLDTIPEPFKDGKHTWFSLGAAGQLHLISGAKTITANKNNHLCFSVVSINTFTAHLAQNELKFENWAGEINRVTTRADGIQQIYFKDPNGYWIEVNDALKEVEN
jgi:lactoylglutathione lyase